MENTVNSILMPYEPRIVAEFPGLLPTVITIKTILGHNLIQQDLATGEPREYCSLE